MRKHLSLAFASGLYLGFIPGAPGTYASVAATVAFYLVYLVSYRILPELHLSVTAIVAALGAVAAADVAKRDGRQDPRYVVIDEVAGQLTAFLLVPVSMLNLGLGLVLFRVFDIFKPFPIRRLEKLPNGVGVMADDLVAGLYANLVLQALNLYIGLSG